ncbi:DNA replication/repair protein RecF [Shouchella lonarensis]|uniref:DNA replication and repair protein RecF n=1 Tax=Shouchella lonarensis TaxID=1464122 RepID=A0A1G6NLT8_9BACI|nr:DNA replication/repair protein RecF [Shouchella lonarensis]SDC68843.1 DNA replication and repair protein RecF [Shouchella lonarensis]
MYIRSLALASYRNYSQLSVSFDPGINILQGENAQGKTNILEAIFVAALAKSHRVVKDKQLIQIDKTFARVNVKVSKRTQDVELDFILSHKGKHGKINGLQQRRLSEYVGNLNVVMFAPEDLALVKGSPQVRRRFIDMELGQMSPIYLQHLTQYSQVLKQRNVLLKKLQVQTTSSSLMMMLDVLTEQLIIEAAVIMHKRAQFLQQLQQWAQVIHEKMSRKQEMLKLRYLPSVEVSDKENLSKIKEELYSAYKQKKMIEVKRGITLFGPHRDDMAISVNEMDVHTYGSQGQQRTAALSIKLAEIDLIYAETGEFPVLLLDDVLSELDRHRQSQLLETIDNRVQTFVTTTTTNELHQTVLEQAQTFYINQGTLEVTG